MKIRKQTYSLGQYLKLIKDETIRGDQDCQRLSGQWNTNMVNELISTVLTGNYIPPIILGEETINGITRQWLIDGLQRSSSLSMFRYGNTKITKNLDEYMVTYQRKVLDANGKPKRDDHGEIIWKTEECDIRNKTYDKLPDELKDIFNGYQMELAIYQNCDTTEISKLVRKYNNHQAMNQAQRSFTYIDAFSREIREITKNRFFLDIFSCNRRSRINGTLERVVGDMVLLCNYPDKYRKDTKAGFKWLNENGTIYDFETTNGLLTKLTDALSGCAPEVKELFNTKNGYIIVAAFKAFTEMSRNNKEFGEFLEWFVSGGNKTGIDGKTWDVLDENRSSRDSSVVHGKLDYLLTLTKQYIMENKKAA